MGWTGTLRDRGGVASLGQLLEAGATAEVLGRRVRDGGLFRPRRGYYALPDAPPLAVAAVRAGGRLSCLLAAGTYGLWAGQEGQLHVTVPAKATRLPDPEGGAVRHWITRTGGSEVWRLSVDDCLKSVVRCASTEDAVAVLDTAISSGLVRFAELASLFDREPSWTAAIVRVAKPGSESGVESLARQRLERHGHHVEQQVHIRGVGRVDMRIDGRVLIEIDGYAFHSDRDAFERDRHRDAELVRRGHRVLRFSARQVFEEWRQVETAIEAALAIPESPRDAPLRTPELRSFAG
jgi:very-short-patch-repair endonuclease